MVDVVDLVEIMRGVATVREDLRAVFVEVEDLTSLPLTKVFVVVNVVVVTIPEPPPFEVVVRVVLVVFLVFVLTPLPTFLVD